MLPCHQLSSETEGLHKTFAAQPSTRSSVEIPGQGAQLCIEVDAVLADMQNLFRRTLDDDVARKLLRLESEMLVPEKGVRNYEEHAGGKPRAKL